MIRSRQAVADAADDEAKVAEQDRLVRRAIEDEAARKAQRDARYAARQARKS